MLKLYPCEFQPFRGTFFSFSGEHVQVKGYITFKIVFVLKENAEMIKVKYLIVDAPFCTT